MGRLIDDVLLLSRLSRKELDPVEIGMEELVRSAFAEAVAEEPGREVRLELDPLPAQWGDCLLLREVWSRLLANAVKFTRPRPVAVIHVGCRAGEKENVYFIQDNGVGFDPRYAHRLFELFQRLHSDDEFEGSGASLAIAHRIITHHGGRVWAEGQPDDGATFYFALKPATSAK
jgi:two-component system sensor kinase